MNTTLNRWNPMRELEDFQHRILSAFRHGADAPRNGQESLVAAEWMPLVDITEDAKEYVISAELPEVSRDDVKVTMENRLLTIRGERRLEREEGRKHHRMERFYGAFARSFAMPDDGDPASVRADFKDGVLRIRIAKSETARPRQVEVKLG